MSDTILSVADVARYREWSRDEKVWERELFDSHEALRQQVATLTEERDKEHQKYLTKAAALAEVTAERDALREDASRLMGQIAKLQDDYGWERNALREERDAERQHANMVRDRLLAERDKARDSVVELNERCDVLFRDRDALREELAKCEPYLKDGETPAVCIERNRGDIDALMTLLAAKKQLSDDGSHEHQFPEVDHEGTLVAYPCLLCGLPAGDALKQASEDRASFEADISRDVDVIHELERERDALREELATERAKISGAAECI